ncbi:MAG: hypothetical protein ABF489_02470 [Bifidobacterium sp.]|uniref:hypothetical protein n=1 Tax=Bifidobacterium sp. TaxID=41200 RepID=UPI0039EC5FA1
MAISTFKHVGASTPVPFCQELGIAINEPVDIDDTNIPGVKICLSLRYSADVGRIIPVGLSLSQRDDSNQIELNGTLIRKLQIKKYVQTEVNGSLWSFKEGEWKSLSPFDSILDAANLKQKIANKELRTSDEELYRWVARIYRFYEVINEPPMQKVETLLGITHTRAARWIKTARETVDDWDGSELRAKLSME